MAKKVITSPLAPKAIGPYSQAVEIGGFVFVSGCLPLDPVTGEIVGGDIKTQTETILKNMENVLKAAKLDFKHVVKSTLFMTDLTSFADLNEVYGRVFKENPPARTTVQVSALPKGALIEIEVIAKK
ncbi:Putative endoribonuclease [Elusimicrobium minutum Pei191]|uniref:Putative endoribonuclease n=1 Tax=Elusimicrobium minutum (strain Pei191) TaxID=445932 RepID=B2KBC2_ELUMP|nr:RidA family protein [Elusimicrobium minutum]ACC97944.1 Putative endoribonuclease [Elusimicrobium minutum Pei191]